MQKNKYINVVFITLFLMMILLPLFTINLKDNVISDAENRYLASKAKVLNEDGTFNTQFMTDFETWANDNIGFRSKMVIANAKIQYNLFRVLSNNSDMYLGPKGELNYATEEMLVDYQHNNLYGQEYLDNYAQSMQTIADYVESQGSQFYYFQCWDKHSIYPEQFPTSVIQHGNVSKTDMLIQALNRNTTVNVVSPKAELIVAKEQYNTYSRWGDPSHWTTRGSIIGFNQLLSVINTREGTDYHLLTDEDFNIKITDQGMTVFGGIHEADHLEAFEFKKTNSKDDYSFLTLFADDPRSSCIVNSLAQNDKTVLLIADSYFASYCVWDFSYTFKKVFFIHADHIEDLPKIIEAYPADYVILERAERTDSSYAIIQAANKIKEMHQVYMSFEAGDLYTDQKQEYSEYIILEPGGIQFGPYAPIDEGRYRVVVYGSDMEALNEECIYINPNSWYSVSPENVTIQDDKIEYQVEFKDELYKLELGIRNLSGRSVKIHKIEVYRE